MQMEIPQFLSTKPLTTMKMQPAIAWLVPSPPKVPMSFMWNPMVTQYLRNVCYCWSCSFFGFYSIVLGWFSSQSYSLRLLRSLWRGFKTIFLLWALVIMGHTHLTLALVGKLSPLIVLISSCSAFRVLCLILFRCSSGIRLYLLWIIVGVCPALWVVLLHILSLEYAPISTHPQQGKGTHTQWQPLSNKSPSFFKFLLLGVMEVQDSPLLGKSVSQCQQVPQSQTDP